MLGQKLGAGNEAKAHIFPFRCFAYLDFFPPYVMPTTLVPSSYPFPGGADADGSDYAAALGQKLVLAVGQAADDCAAVFGRAEGGGRADLAAARLVWALQETERWVGPIWDLWGCLMGWLGWKHQLLAMEVPVAC